LLLFLTYFGFKNILLTPSNLNQNSGQLLTQEALKSRLDDLKWILGLIITAAGLFAVAQAASSYFNAQAFTKQAEDSIKRIETLEKDLQERFPFFTKIERIRKEAYGTLASIFGEEDSIGANDLYGSLSSHERQKTLVVEHFVGIEFLQMDSDPQFADNLRRLGNLYASKFRYDRTIGYQTDLERAEYYLINALERANEKISCAKRPRVLSLSFTELTQMQSPKIFQALRSLTSKKV